MNTKRLKAVELEFLSQFPGGFDHPAMLEIGKKHQVHARTKQAQEFFAIERFDDNLDQIVDNMLLLINRSSLVSRFEKPRLRDWLKILSEYERENLALALKEILHGDQEDGFNTMLSLLEPGKLANWTLMTVIPYYYSPRKEVFVKPTTTKNIIRFFELENLIYHPRPSYDFYVEYRKQIIAMRNLVDPSLQYDNAAFSGFLMMAMQSKEPE